ncbi:glycosyltransferase [Algibacter sp.]|nr:glycosyltransferase [Algibacter sp.]
MKVLQTISGMGINSGGPTTCTYILVKGLIEAGVNVKILTFESDAHDSLISNEELIETIKKPLEGRFGYSTRFKNTLQKYSDMDIIHTNGLWQYPSHRSAVFSFKNKIPFVFSTHGMLNPEAMKNSAFIKNIAMRIFQKKDLQRAKVIHATCKQEMAFIRALGFTNPIAIIPNAIDIKIPSKKTDKSIKKKQVGFIGRFDPIKNLEILFEAWSKSGKNNPEWELVLIGDGDNIYKKSLIQLANKLEIKNIRFTGFLSGEEKEIALQNLNYLVLPSKSENFGMVVSEALIREVPVIASKGTPWEELNTCNAGWWIDLGVEPLKKALINAIQTPKIEMEQMGKNGRKLIEKKYSMEAVASQMLELYQWILTKENKPNFVETT